MRKCTAIFRIGEFSKLTQASIRMLRYYDETGLLKPARVDEFTGHRLYSVEQIPLLHKILFLRDTGFNVSEIALALKNWDNALVAEELENKRREIEARVGREQEKLAKIDTALPDLNKEKASVRYNIVIKSIPSYQVLSLRRIIPDYFCEGMLWEELSEFIRSGGLDIPQNSIGFAIFHDAEYKESDVDVEVCVEVDRPGENKNGFVYRITEKIDTMACAMVYGPFENIAGAYTSFAHWLIQHSLYKITGRNRQKCHRGLWNEEDPEKYLTEIQIPVKRI